MYLISLVLSSDVDEEPETSEDTRGRSLGVEQTSGNASLSD